MGANGCALTPGDGHALECGEACARVDVGAMVLPLQLAHQAVLHSADASGRQTAQLGARRSLRHWRTVSGARQGVAQQPRFPHVRQV